MFDITNETSFINLRSWLEQLRTHAYCDTPDVIICGNKADLFDRRVVSEERAKFEAQKYGSVRLALAIDFRSRTQSGAFVFSKDWLISRPAHQPAKTWPKRSKHCWTWSCDECNEWSRIRTYDRKKRSKTMFDLELPLLDDPDVIVKTA